MLLGWNIYVTNAVIGGLVIVYTASGGARAVNWTQTQQFAICILGMVAAFAVIVHSLPADVSFLRMSDRQRAVDEVILSDPAVASVASSIGSDGINATSNSGRVSITLKPRNDRDVDATEIIARLQPKLAQVAGIALYLQPVQDLQIETRTTRTQYQYTLEDADPGELADWAPRMLDRMRRLPQLADVASDEASDGLQLRLDIDRDTASRLGISPQRVISPVRDSCGILPGSSSCQSFFCVPWWRARTRRVSAASCGFKERI